MKFEPGARKISTGKMDVAFGPAYWFLFYRDELVVADHVVNSSGLACTEGLEMPDKCIPFITDIKIWESFIKDIQYLGQIDGKDGYLAELTQMPDTREYACFGLRLLYGKMEDEWYWLANRAFHLYGWRKKNRYCGCCGLPLSSSEHEVALVCDACGNVTYPRISPAVIVAILDGDKILLARSSRFPDGMYSTIAGFVEPGETLEQCAAREIREEVGVEVRNIRYFGNQPWPYPDSLMIAFTAEYAGGDICIDNKEIVDASWFTKDTLPNIPLKLSIARKMIDWFCEQQVQDK